MFLKSELKKFIEPRPRSKTLWDRSLQVLPGGVSHNIRNLGLPSIGGFPVFIKEAKGPNITDIDNFTYTDYWCGHYAKILGHKPPEVLSAIKEYLENGWHFGTVIENQVRLAERLIKDNKGIEKVRFCTSGTESTMYASRLARAFTGKRLIAKAQMGWHGANDTLFYNVRYPFTGQESAGILSQEEAGVLTFHANTESVCSLIKKHAQDLAGIIIEPFLGGGGGFPVKAEFLKMLREETEKYGIMLIFDEVITGYRFGYGLYQDIINVIPDLTTMGKIVGGGMPLGVVGGRDEILEMANPLRKNRVWIGGGTFSANPLSMISGITTLDLLKKSKANYERINSEGESLLKKLNTLFKEGKFRLLATGQGSMITIHCLKEYLENPNPLEIVNNTSKKREALLQLVLLNRNITGMHGIGSISFSHQPEHLKHLKSVFDEISKPLSEIEF
ncbi:MAG: aspartate aminotransferase family protein [Candidatus Hodarchaeales archaeon]